jgi:PAS domain S-box-containing protein
MVFSVSRLHWIIFLIGVLTLSACGLYWWQLETSQGVLRQASIAQAEKRASQLAEAMAEQAGTLVQGIDFALLQLRDAYGQDQSDFERVVDSVVRSYPSGAISSIAVMGADGYAAYSTRGLKERVFVGDRPYFTAYRDGRDRLGISKPIFGRIAHEWIILFTRPIFRDGRFAGVMVFSLTPQYLSAKLARLEVSPRDTIVLLHADGSFLARNRDVLKAMGQAVKKDRPFLVAGSPPRGVFHASASLDRVPRIFAWHRLAESDLLVAVGLDQEAVLEPLDQEYRQSRMRGVEVGLLILAFGGSIMLLLLRVARQQQQMSSNETQYRRLYESMTDPYVRVDMDGKIQESNPAYQQMLGYAAEELLGLSCKAMTPDAWHQMEARIISEQVIPKGHCDVYEKEYTRKDGTVFPVELRAYLMSDNQGKPAGMWAIVHDISQRRAAEEERQRVNKELERRVVERTVALSEMAELNERILEASVLGIAAYKASGQCVFANECTARTVNATKEQMLAQNFREIPSWKTSGILALALKALETGEPQHGEFNLRTSFGKEGWLDCYFARFMRGGEAHLLLIVSDITERKRAEEALIEARDAAERASRAKSEFLSRMSHELRTPMNAILGFSQVLEVEPLNAEQQSFVREIHRAGDHLLELINELLDLSAIESGRLETVIQSVALQAAMEQAIHMVRPLLQRQGIALIDQCEQEIAVLADATRLKQVLVNLLSNAAKYNRAGGSIRIDCKLLDAERMRLSVTDTGRGIVPEKLGLLFQPFERLGISASTAIEGTGIGLAISKRLIELMGGAIGVDSTPGQGSTFWIELPLAQSPQQADAAEPTALPDVAQGMHKILYVEDNAANLKVVEAMLRNRPNLTVLSASNGEYGLELAQRYVPDVILLDIHLPGMDGYAVLKALQAHPETRGIPVIALSADAMPLDVERGLAAGFRRYLTKPVKVKELIDAVEQLAAERR